MDNVGIVNYSSSDSVNYVVGTAVEGRSWEFDIPWRFISSTDELDRQ